MQQTIQSYYDAFNRGDREAMFALLHDGVVHDLNQGGRETGLAAFRSFMERMDRCYRETVEDLAIFTGPDNRAAAEFYIRGEYQATDAGLPEARGQTYRLRVGAFFEARGGKLTRVTNYYNLQQWLKMVA